MKTVTQKVSVRVDGKDVPIEPKDHPTGTACVFGVPTTLDEALDQFGEEKILDFVERQHTQDVANAYRVAFKDTRDNPIKAERIGLFAELVAMKSKPNPERAVEIAMRLAVIGVK